MLTTRGAILLLLLDQKPAFGLEIIESGKRRSKGRLDLKEGSVYPALKALEVEGLLRSHEDEESRQGRPRIFYSLTPKGAREARLDREGLSEIMYGPLSGPANLKKGA